jgi:predicted DNA-binding ribbon-helix-helix protein
MTSRPYRQGLDTAIRKRSISHGGKKTSVSLEDEFWRALHQVAAESDLSVTDVVGEIDRDRGCSNLSSAIRLFVLRYYMRQQKDSRALAGEESSALA